MKKRKKVLASLLSAAMLVTLSAMPSRQNSAISPTSISAHATQSRSSNFSKSYSVSGNNADSLISVANAQLGKTGATLGYTEEWCADFVTDCARLAGNSGIPYNYSSRGAARYLYSYMVNNCGASVVGTPQRGDLIFFDWSGKKNTNNIHHVAIVTSYSNNQITVIGGNQGSGSSYKTRVVSTAKYSKNYSCICRIVRPKYANSGTSSSSTKNKITNAPNYFAKYTGKSASIVTALKSIGVNSSFSYRAQIAAANSISSYSGTAAQNTQMLNLLKQGKLIKPKGTATSSTPTPTTVYFKKYTGTSGSIVTALKSIGANSSYSYRQKIAKANGISGYIGSAAQNTKLLGLLKQGKLKKP